MDSSEAAVLTIKAAADAIPPVANDDQPRGASEKDQPRGASEKDQPRGPSAEDDPREPLTDVEVSAGARGQPAGARPDETNREPGDVGDEDSASDLGPSELDGGERAVPGIVAETVMACAKLDHSDTDNGTRLLKHFGADLRVLKLADAKTPAYVVWGGTHWDVDNGTLYAHAVAQKVGAVIGMEADYITATPFERERITSGDQAEVDLAGLMKREANWTDKDRALKRQLERLVNDGDDARAGVEKRQVARRKFAVSSKNAARIASMLTCAGPHCAVDPDDFNADPFVVGTKEHTLRFVRKTSQDGWREAGLACKPGHDRADMLTRIVPVSYDPQAECPHWRAFLDEFLPVEAVRTFVQTFSGIGLLGITVQMLMFHYGSGANGKSVFLETLTRVLGALAVGLPAESITGQGDRGAGNASPDLARLYGARTVRILELPQDKPLHEDLVKKLTGGEKIPVRTLFKGYFEFTPIFTAHMSGNGYPRVDGTDNGIWRRLKVVEWPVQLAPDRQRPFDEVLADFAPEYPGILNWLIDGAVTFLEKGLVTPLEVEAATQDYRSAMDPISDFVKDCVEVVDDPGQSETARAMFDAYVSWGQANAHKPFSETRFGRDMKKKFKREDGRIRRYLGVRLHDVPARSFGRGDEAGLPEPY